MSRINVENINVQRPFIHAPRYRALKTTLKGDFIVTVDTPTMMFFDPGGANRNIRMVPVSIIGGQHFQVSNVGSANNLILLSNDGVQIGILGPGEDAYLTTSPGVSGGSGWRVSKPGGAGTVVAGVVSFSPSGGLNSFNVQDALTELDTEKASIASLASVAFSGSVADLLGEATLIKTQVLAGGSAVNSNLTLKATTGVGDGTEYIAFGIGNNGASEGGRIIWSGPGSNPIGPKFVMGATQSIVSFGSFHSQFQLHGLGTVGSFTGRWDNIAAGTFNWVGKSRGGAVGVHSAAQGGDTVLNWTSVVSDGSKFIQSVRIRTHVDLPDGTPLTADRGVGKMFIATVPEGTSMAPLDRFGIWSDGGIQIGGTMFSATTAGPPAGSATPSPGPNVVLIGGQVLAPLTIAGGNTPADHLTLKATTGAGAGTEYISLAVGNNGALECGRIVNFTGPNPGPRFVFGATASIPIIQDWSLQLHGGGALGVGLAKYGADTAAPFWVSAKSRGATPGSHTVVASNDILLNQQGAGSDGTDFRTSVQIRGRADGAPVATTIPGTNFGMTPGKLFFSTVPNLGAPQATVTGAVARIGIWSDGGIQIGGTINETTTPSPGANTVDIQAILAKAFAPSFGGYVAGRIYTAIGGGSAVVFAVSADVIYWFPFFCGEKHTFPSMAIEVTTAGAATNMRAGIYTCVNGVANTLVVDSGSVALSGGTGVKTAALTGAALTPGTYWLGMKFNGAVTLAGTSNASLSSFLPHGATSFAAPNAQATSAHTFATALPASAPAFTYNVAILPILGLTA